MEKLEKEQKGVCYREERIREIGRVLFQLLETNP